ncbi:MAG: SMP-30/gluconolactonase/LRE family protein [Planctomycetes bacterium]|nr:SMP-30/gluconolactonase/LRE family protein [Planctomycetota bacterium]
MRTNIFIVVIVMLTTYVASGDKKEKQRKSEQLQLPAPTGKMIVAKNSKLELLFSRKAKIEGGLTEGPAVAPDGSIYFSDIPMGSDKGMIMRFDPRSKKTKPFTKDSYKSNGLIFDSKGFLLSCEGADDGGRGIARWNVETGERTTIVDRYRGMKFNAPNDICLDKFGRIYFTDPRYVGDEPRELPSRAVYRVETDGSVDIVTENVHKPNGIAISPDATTLYLAEHDNGTDKIDPDAPAPKQGAMRIYAFNLDDKGTVRDRRTIVEFGEKKGCDGMCVDTKGNIYLTVRDACRPGVLIVNPRGKEVGFIPTGAADQEQATATGLPSNVEFGIGKDSNTLYVTVDTSLYRIRLKSQGFHVQYSN